MAAIYSNGGNRWNILGFNFTKRDALSTCSVYKISMLKTHLHSDLSNDMPKTAVIFTRYHISEREVNNARKLDCVTQYRSECYTGIAGSVSAGGSEVAFFAAGPGY